MGHTAANGGDALAGDNRARGARAGDRREDQLVSRPVKVSPLALVVLARRSLGMAGQVTDGNANLGEVSEQFVVRLELGLDRPKVLLGRLTFRTEDTDELAMTVQNRPQRRIRGDRRLAEAAKHSIGESTANENATLESLDDATMGRGELRQASRVGEILLEKRLEVRSTAFLPLGIGDSVQSPDVHCLRRNPLSIVGVLIRPLLSLPVNLAVA